MLTLAGMEADVIMAKLLPFQRQMVAELIEDDGLCVTAPGLGWTRILAVLLYLQILRRRNAAERGAVLVVGCTDWQRRALRDELLMLDPQLRGSEHDAVDSAEDIVLPEDVGDPDEVPDDIVEENAVEPELPVDITNSTPSLQRIRLYRTKSCLFITTRILVVDMLNSRVRGNQVSGVVVLNAHRVTDMSGEAFAVRLFRMANRRGTVRAFSDQPVRLSSGFCKVCCTWPMHSPHSQPTMDHPSIDLALQYCNNIAPPALLYACPYVSTQLTTKASGQVEKVMKALFLRKLYLWPRFQAQVKDALDMLPTEVWPSTTVRVFSTSAGAAGLHVVASCN